MSEINYSGPPMIRIDGGQIRRIREEKGLTQLYIATVVGVTTDTISRWENRRYPSIKKENGEKLAEALAVELDELLETSLPPEENQPLSDSVDPERPEAEESQASAVHSPKTRSKKIMAIAVLAVVCLSLIYLAWRRFLPEKPLDISATRILPAHIPPGQLFPIMIVVESAETESLSVIVKESLTKGVTVIKGIPRLTSLDPGKSMIKWIFTSTGNRAVFSYLAQAADDLALGEQISFAGTVSVSGQDRPLVIGGPGQITVQPFHWADLNRDNRIDDEEILAVYDQLNQIEELGYNRDQVDEIWSGSGYRWDREQGRLIVFQ